MSRETILDFYAITKELRIFAEGNGFSVVFKREDDNSAPSANSRGVIELTAPMPDWTAEQVTEWKWQCYHEIGHQVPEMRDIFTLMHDHNIDLSKKTLFGGILNLLDDHRQERHRLGWYPGRDSVLSKGGAEFVRNKIIPRVTGVNMDDQEEFIQMIDTMLGADCAWRSSWQRDFIGIDTLYQKHFSERQQAWLDKLLSYKQDVHDMKTADDVYELTKRIIREVFEEDEQEKEEEAQGDGRGGEEGEGDQDGKGEGTSAASDNGEGESEDRSASGCSGEDRDKRDSEAKVKYEDILSHDHSKGVNGASYKPLEVDYSDYGSSQYAKFNPTLDPEVVDFVSGNGTDNVSNRTEYATEASRLNVGGGLANRIRKLLQVKSQAITTYGHKKGKLAGKSIYRATMTGTGDYQNRVFKKKIDNNILDTSVTVLADFSGSMGGEKQVHSIASALMLNDALAKIGVPVELLGFTESDDTQMYVFKNHLKPVSKDALIERMGRASAYNMGGNADGEAILWAYERLRRQGSKRKLLIVLSDGQPACWRGGDIYGYTKEVIKAIEDRNDVEIYGIGIMSSSVQRLYKHNRVISNASELEGAVLNVIKEYILN